MQRDELLSTLKQISDLLDQHSPATASRMLAELIGRLEQEPDRIEHALEAFADTQKSTAHRIIAIMNTLGHDVGPDAELMREAIAYESLWYLLEEYGEMEPYIRTLMKCVDDAIAARYRARRRKPNPPPAPHNG